jgi:hypothetical protein
MKSPFLLLLIALLMLHLPVALLAASNSAVVCGVALSDVDEFGWGSFKAARGKPFIAKGDRDGLLRELQSMLREESTEWPEEVRLPAVKSMAKLIEGAISFPVFALHKTGGFPAEQFAFNGSPDKIAVPIPADDPLCLTQSGKQSRIAVAKFVNLVQRSGVEIDSPSFKHVAQRIKSLEEVYDKYLYEGFPMFPWEALANSWLLTDKAIADGPPHNQLVLLHPAAGLVGAVGSSSRTDVGATLSIEPVGWVHYSANYDSWYGASLLAVFPGDRNAGLGLALNYNSFKLGVTWHDYAAGDGYEDPTLFVGMELYQLLSKQQRRYQGYMERVKDLRK